MVRALHLTPGLSISYPAQLNCLITFNLHNDLAWVYSFSSQLIDTTTWLSIFADTNTTLVVNAVTGRRWRFCCRLLYSQQCVTGSRQHIRRIITYVYWYNMSTYNTRSANQTNPPPRRWAFGSTSTFSFTPNHSWSRNSWNLPSRNSFATAIISLGHFSGTHLPQDFRGTGKTLRLAILFQQSVIPTNHDSYCESTGCVSGEPKGIRKFP